MINIKYKAIAFPKSLYGNKLSGEKILSVDWHDLIWSAITVGKKNRAHITKNGIYSVYEIINRSTLIWFSLKTHSNHLVKTDVYNEMDPTEKVFVSFSLGMVFSKLFSEKLLNTPWLEHVANLNQRITVNSNTRSRPDLIGKNIRGEYIVLEAKGRTNKFDKTAQITAKNQSKVISKVAGKSPVLRVASQTYFNESLEVYLEDPEGNDNLEIEVSTEDNLFLQSYYEIFHALSEQDIRLLERIGIKLSFVPSLNQAFKTEDYCKLNLKIEESYFDTDEYKVFPDGIKIKLDENVWSMDQMKSNPVDRTGF